MEQVLLLAKHSLLAVQIYMSGICYSTCHYERAGTDGVWSNKHQACVCHVYVTPEDSFEALKLSPSLRGVKVTEDKAEEPQPTESPSYLKPYQYDE